MRTWLNQVAKVCKWVVLPWLVVQGISMMAFTYFQGDIELTFTALFILELGMLGIILASAVLNWFCKRFKDIIEA